MQMSKQVSIYKHDIAAQDTFATKQTIAVCRNHSLLFTHSLLWQEYKRITYNAVGGSVSGISA